MKVKNTSRWRSVYYKGVSYYNVGTDADGVVIYNPNNYPDDLVRAVVAHAEAVVKAERSKAAKKAGETRRHRVELKIAKVAKEWTEGNRFGPRDRCIICQKPVYDAQSVARGIGSDCWQHTLAVMEDLAQQEEKS